MSVVTRMLGLLGLVLVMVLVTDSAWAQYIVSSLNETPGTFPYLSPDITQRNLLINAFNFQMSMFGALSGGGKLVALNYFALTGCLVGALMVIFNPKYRKATILAPWLIVVVITVFAPYGSKLLFYPVAKEALSSAGLTSMGTQPVTDCKGENALRCGFTPQLAAIHVASTLQLMFSDVFKSIGWDGLMQRIEGEANLGKAEELVMDGRIADVDLPKYKSQCSSMGFDRLAALYTGSATATAADSGGAVGGGAAGTASSGAAPIMTAGNFMRQADTYYNGDMMNMSPPDIAVMYGDADFAAQNWNANAKQSYELALNKIYDGVVGGSHLPVVVGCTQSSSCMKADDALKALDENGFFQTTDDDQNLSPGFFFTWKDAKKFGNYSTDPAKVRSCYRPEPSNMGSNIDMSQNSSYQRPPECSNGAVPINITPETQQSNYRDLRRMSLEEAPRQWKSVYDLLGGSNSSSDLLNMPVGVKSFTADTENVMPQAPAEGEARSTYDCVVEGKKLIDDMVNSAYSETNGKAKLFANLGKMLLGGNDHTDVPPVLERSNLTSVTKEDADLRGQYDLNNRVDNYLGVLNGRFLEGNRTLDMSDEKVRHTLLLTIFLKKMEESTAAARPAEVTQNAQERAAARDGRTTEVVGSTGLTWLGGGIAKFLGSWVANIGSAFIGPFSQALVYFLSILVDIAMLAMIVLTPFLFLAGLFIPSTAAGVLSIVVIGSFVLKFVPVTLIILNNLGMMIYRFIGISDVEESRVMQSLIIIAMAGLYANLVGMTFFLLFKLGDPSAVLGRLTALDGAANQLADKGMALTIAAATTAATLATGGAMAALGYGSMANSARKAANRLGISNDMIDGAQSIMSDGAKGLQDDKDIGGASDIETRAAMTAGEAEMAETEMLNKLRGSEGDAGFMGPLSEAAMQKKNTEDFDKDPQALGLIEQMRAEGFSDKEIADFKADGSLTKDGRIYGREGGLLTSASASGDSGDMFSSPNAASTQRRFGAGVGGTAVGAIEGGSGSPLGVQEGSNLDAAAQDSVEGRAAALGAPGATASAPGAPTGAGAVAGAAVVQGGGAPIQVSVVDGKLSSVGEVGNMQALSDVQSRAAEIETQNVSQQVATLNEQIETAMKNASADDLTKLKAAQSSLSAVNSASDLQSYKDSDQSRAIRSALIDSQGREDYTRNMNDQIASEITRVNGMLGKGDLSAKRVSELKSYKESLGKIDPVAMTQGELMASMGTLDEMKRSIDIRGAADKMPGLGQTVWSGVYGAFSGGGGALSRIPIIGKAISEATNEYYEAPERARAWNAAGGRAEYNQLKADSQRLGFYNKAMSPIATGTQYQSMQAVGAFQAQADIARQQAGESVAKSRSMYEAMVVNSQNMRGGSPNNENYRSYMTVGEMSGLGRMEAANRIASVRQEAFLMRGDSMMVERAVIKGTNISALDSNMQLKMKTDGKGNLVLDSQGQPQTVDFEVKKVNTIMTPQALHKIQGDINTKKLATSYDDMMIAHYSLAEKQFLRGSHQWDATRDMNKNARAAATFSRQDVDTNYLIGGHTKMVEGKIRFKDNEGQYKKLVEFRNDENAMKAEFIRQSIKDNGGLGGALAAAAKAGKYDMSKEAGLFGQQLQTFRREALDKFATAQLKDTGRLLKLEAVFDEAGATGLSKYEEKAMIAPARQAMAVTRVTDAMNKEYAKVFNSVTNMDAAAFKDSSVRMGGVPVKLDSLVTWLTTNLSDSLKPEDMGRAVSVITDSLKNVKNGGAVSFSAQRVEGIVNGIKREMAVTTNGLDEDGFAAVATALQNDKRSDPGIFTAVMGLFKKDVIPSKDGTPGKTYYRGGSAAVDEDGTKLYNANIENARIVSPKKGNNKTDNDDD